MRLPAHLRRHPVSGIFYFRFAIPAALRERVGRREITRTLNTRRPDEAQWRAFTLAAHVQHALHVLRNAMSPYDPKRFNPTNPATWPTAKADGLGDFIMHLPNGIAIEVDPESPKDIAEAEKTAVRLLENTGYDKRLVDRPSAPMAPTLDPMTKPKRLSAAIVDYVKALQVRNPKTAAKYALGINHFRNWLAASEFADKDPWLHEIWPDHVAQWKEVLCEEAQERAAKKRERGHAKRMIEADPELAKVPLDVKLRTANNYFEALSVFFTTMQKQNHYPQSRLVPTANMAILSKKERMTESGYVPFNGIEMAQIFDAKNYATLTKPHEYWFPLIALLTGTRREEIAQLSLNDIRIEWGHWILDINDREYRSVKNAAGVRQVPIHPVLLDLGLLDYIETVREVATGSVRLFPYLRYDRQNGFGDVPGEAFARYLDRLGIHEIGKVMHSFRINANDRLTTNNVDEAKRCRMVGHAYNTINTASYTTGISIDMLVKDVLPNLTFPEIDFKALKRPKGFREVLAQEMEAAAKRRAVAQRRKAREAVKQAAVGAAKKAVSKKGG